MKDTPVKMGSAPPPTPTKSRPHKKEGSSKIASRRTKEHKIPIMRVGKTKRPAKTPKKTDEPKKRRGRPKGEEKAVRKPASKSCSKKNEGTRKRKSEPKHSSAAPPLKKPKIGGAVNGDAKVAVNHSLHKPVHNFKVENCSVNTNGTLHSAPKKALVFNPKKNSISLLKSATFHPPISLKKELLNGGSNPTALKLLAGKNNKSSSFKKDNIQSLCKELETNSKISSKVNNISPLAQLTVSNELGRNLAKDIVQFCSKEPAKSKDVAKLLSKETAKYQTKESPKSILKDSSKIHPKETSKPQVRDPGKPQTKDNTKSLPKELAKPPLKDSTKPKDAAKPSKPQPKESAKPQSGKTQPKEWVKVVPMKSHPQRMASLDAMARMHVICTTDRKPPEPRHTSVTHQKSITHERIQFDVKKETNDIQGNIVHKQEINYVKEKQQVFVSHSVEQSSSIVEREQSKTVSTKQEKKKKKTPVLDKPACCSKKWVSKTHPSKAPPLEKGGKPKVQQAPKKKIKEKGSKKVEQQQTQSEVKVKETIRMQKTCTYQSVTTVNSSASSSGGSSSSPLFSKTKKKTVVRQDEECKNNSNKVNFSSASVINNSYCLTTSESGPSDCCKFHHPRQIIPLAHACSLGQPAPASSPTFSVHRFSHPSPILFAPPDCGGCCCSPPQLLADSCLLRQSIVAYPHLPSHHAHHLSAPAFSTETVCSDCHPSDAPRYPSSSCCEQNGLHRLHHHRHHHYLSQKSSASSSLAVPYSSSSSAADHPSPLDLSTTASLDVGRHHHHPCPSSSGQQPPPVLLLRPRHACCRCCKEPEQPRRPHPEGPCAASRLLLQSSSSSPVASTSSGCPPADGSLLTKREASSVSPKECLSQIQRHQRVFAHGWSWKGKPRERLIALTNDSIPCPRICYPSVEHKEGDKISERDCVLLRSGPKDTDLPYVAKVAAFWENPDDGEMMMSLLWYYRPEHTDQGRKTGQMEDEVFASRHKDVNSVACIEDKCYVLTYNEYCRYKASLSMADDAVSVSSRVVPELPDGYARKSRLPCEPVSQDIVFFCRHVYDFRQKRILKNPT